MSWDVTGQGLAVKGMSQDIWVCHGMSQPGQRDHGAFWDVLYIQKIHGAEIFAKFVPLLQTQI